MSPRPLSDIIAAAWEQATRETPAPDWGGFWGPRLTYREQLDRRRVNHDGEVIPRIVLVRRNLQLLGKPARPPRLPA